MNNQQIIDFVRNTGKVRVVQVSDKFDVPPQEAADWLRELVKSGDLKESSGFAPNGLRCPVFDVPDAAPTMTASGFPIPATRVNQPIKPAGAEPAPATQSASAPEPESSQTGKTKAEVAIEFIREKGEATSAELHALLNLKPEEYASNYLASALKDGRLARDGKIWKLGDGTPMAPTPKAKPIREQSISTAKGSGPVAQFEPPKPPASAPAIPAFREVIAQALKPVAPPAFRVGLWSDGMIELQRDGQTVATISQAESSQLLGFLESAKMPKAA